MAEAAEGAITTRSVRAVVGGQLSRGQRRLEGDPTAECAVALRQAVSHLQAPAVTTSKVRLACKGRLCDHRLDRVAVTNDGGSEDSPQIWIST